MTDFRVQQVAAILGELQETTDYKTLLQTGNDLRVDRFHMTVSRLRTRCSRAQGTLDDVRQELGLLQRDCFGNLAAFRSFVMKALGTLGD